MNESVKAMSEETVSRGTNMKRILFYRVNEPYGELSNFAPFPFELKGKRWPTAEHYFQAQKFAGTDPKLMELRTHLR